MKIDSRGAHSVNMTRVVVISVLLFCSLADSARIKSKFISVENKSITFYKLLRSSLFKQKYCLDTFFLNFNIYSVSQYINKCRGKYLLQHELQFSCKKKILF